MKSIIKLSLFIMTLVTSSYASALQGVFLYKYKDGPTYRVTIPDDKTLRWECIDGSEKGAKGEETPIRHRVSQDVYFLSWVEKTGIIVTQVLNLETKKVYSTIVEGKERYVLEGDVSKE